MRKIYNSGSYSFFLKLYNKNNELIKLDSTKKIIFGIKKEPDIFTNNSYLIKKELREQNFIDNEGYLLVLLPSEINLEAGIYYFDIGLQYIKDGKKEYKLLQKPEKISIEDGVTKIVIED